jgi:AAA+ superfamily predicted ATPase
MDAELAVIASLRNAVAALPDDLGLRLHLAGLLMAAGLRDEGVSHLGAVLQADPANATALQMIAAGAAPGSPAASAPADALTTDPTADALTTDPPAGSATTDPPAGSPTAGPPAPESPAAIPASVGPEAAATGDPAPPASNPAGPSAPEPAAADPASLRPGGPAPEPAAGFDWARAEADLGDLLPPMFVAPDGTAADEDAAAGRAFDAERPALRLADVAGLTEVKARLEAAFLAPMRNPELRKLYGKSLRGGLLLYGPPGCGKTFIARAVAGELGAHFMAVSFADIVDMYTGQSERNIREMFATARSSAPCVLFLDEVDAIGQKRSQLRSTPMRTTVNQLLLELDDVSGGNDGVFVLAATNHPWDVDSALRRPGRLDRTLLVLPPDEPAREAVFRYHLTGRPVAGIQLSQLAGMTDGHSAADIAHICESAAELALLDSARSGQVRMIGQHDLVAAVVQVRPSLGPWFDSARNVALYANEGGAYDDLAAYLGKRKLL